MGYALCYGECVCCKNMFGFNPNKVPSVQNEPVCANCMIMINMKRKEMGLQEFFVSKDAYEPCDENELG